MTGESILLLSRGSGRVRDVLDTHAERLGASTSVDSVEVAVYETDPRRELRPQLATIDAKTVYVVPMCVAHTHDTLTAIPAALSALSGRVRYCEPIGGSPAITDVLAARATELVAGGPDTSLVLVGFGSSSKPYNRQTTDYHATRLRERSDYAAVHTCYLLQNPAVECVRYNVATSRAVAVPLFVAPTEATEQRIPDQLELGRGGIEYADPLGTHPRVTDAIRGEVQKQRALGTDETAAPSFEATLTRTQRPMATDGEGTTE
jgi:sirohydrochlorin ferrochelatase